VAQAFRLSAVSLGAAVVLLLPRPADAQTFFLTVNLVNNFSVYNRVNVVNGATGGLIGICATPFFTSSCPMVVAGGTEVRIIAVATTGIDGSGPIPSRLSAGTGPAAVCALSSCAFTMTADAAVTVTINSSDASPMSSITTTIAGDAPGQLRMSGDICSRTSLSAPQVCTASYLTGSTVWLDHPAPRGAGRFSGYSGGTGPASMCGTAAECEMTLSSNATVTATFVALTSILVTPGFSAGWIGGPPTVFQATGTYSDSSTQPLEAGPGEWHTAPPLPVPSAGLAAAALGGKIYAMGGQPTSFDPTTVTNALSAFDPATQSWAGRTPMFVRRRDSSAAAAGGLLYAIGGLGAGTIDGVFLVPGPVLASMERYDPGTNTWTMRASMAAPRTGLVAGSVNGIIYAAGGADAGGTALATLEAYDPATDTWTPRAPMPTPRSFAVGGVIDGILYVAGGSSFTSLTTVEAYDPATNAWTTKAPLPVSLATSAAAVADGVLYVMTTSGTVYAYDSVADSWSAKSSLAPAIAASTRAAGAAASLDGIVYAIGGVHNASFCCNHSLATVETFLDSLRWSVATPAVARVDQNGSVMARAPGTTTVIARSGSVSCGGTCGTYKVYGPSSLELNGPTNGTVLSAPFTVIGWALNPGVPIGTGVSTVHVWAFPAGSGSGIFLGEAAYGLPRPDVGAAFGSQFTNSGFSLTGGASLAPGPYTLGVYGRSVLTGSFDVVRTVNVTIAGPVSHPFIDLDSPREGFVVTSSFEVGGWALDTGAPTGTGVDAVQFYIFPNDGAAPGVFIGQGSYGLSRPDVGAIFGSPRYDHTGFHYTISGLGPGAFVLGVYARSTVTGTYSIVKTVHITVNATALMAVNPPVPESIITAPIFDVDGWSIDRSIESTALSGSGVDTLHVYAYPNPGSGAPPIFLGVAAVGLVRPDVAALYGSRYGTSGFHLAVDRSALGLSPGVYNIAVHSHSTVSSSFNNLTVVRVTLQ